MKRLTVRSAALGLLSGGLTFATFACGTPSSTLPAQNTPSPVAAPSTVASPSAVSSSPPASALPSPSSSAQASGSTNGVRFTFDASQTEASYHAREQLAGNNLPTDAIGTTNAVTGQIVLTPAGSIVADQSKVTVDLTTLKSDRSQRDNYLQRNTLNTNQYPSADFDPTQVTGLDWPLPTSGDTNFQFSGPLTVHGVTKESAWDVTGRFDDLGLQGMATYSFTLDDFSLPQPQVALVLSIEPNLTLEIDFRAVKS